jgi:hypothetical protein
MSHFWRPEFGDGATIFGKIRVSLPYATMAWCLVRTGTVLHLIIEQN